MELDIYLPELALAFEYQGRYHYEDHTKIGSPLLVQKRDNAKKLACQHNGISLIVVPYTWKKDIQAIVQSLRTVRPDVTPIQDIKRYKELPYRHRKCR
jgi:hypothetical protein